jgi:GNAT superfamily N-acetyltransferase
VSVNNAASRADGGESLDTPDDCKSYFRTLENCDPARDMLVAEHDGQPVAFALVQWWDNDAGERVFNVHFEVHPDWRSKGIGGALFDWGLARRALRTRRFDTSALRLPDAT